MNATAPPRRLSWAGRPVWALAACGVGLALRLGQLGAESLWYDETVSAHLAALPLTEMVAHTALDIHPPGYYLLLHCWSGLAGSTEYALAFLSLLAGMALIPATWLLAKRAAGPVAANLAAWLTALSAYSVWYSQEVRMYTVAALLLTVLVAITARLLSPSPGGAWWLAWAAVAAAALYCLYYSLFLLPFLSLTWFIKVVREGDDKRYRRLARWLGAHAALLVLYAPWLPTAMRQALDPPVPAWRSSLPWLEALRQGASALALGEAAPDAWWPLALALVAAAFWAAQPKRSGGGRSWLLAVAFAGPWALTMGVSAIQPLFHPRYLFPFAPFFLASLAIALTGLPSSRWARAGAVIVAGVFVLANLQSVRRMWTLPEYRADDLRGAVQELQARWAPGDVVLVQAGYTYTALTYYWDGEPAWLGRVGDYAGAAADDGPVILLGGSLRADADLGWGEPDSDFYATDLADTVAGIQRALEGNRRLWLFRLYDTVTDPLGEVRQWLDESLLSVADFPMSGPSFGRLQAFVPRREALSCDDRLLWGDWAVTCLEMGPASAGGKLPLYLELQSGGGATEGASLHYTMRLRDAAGADLAQTDGALIWPQRSDDGLGPVVLNVIALQVPTGLAPGSYHLALGLYTFEDGSVRSLPATDSSRAVLSGPDGLLDLGEVQVP